MRGQKLWRCSLDRYRRDLRNATIERFVRDKLDGTAAEMVRAVMKMQGVAREGLAGMTGALGGIGSPGALLESIP